MKPSKPSKSFKTKIPSKLHEDIFEWYCCGLNNIAIQAKLESEHGFHTNSRTLSRLLAFMKEEKQLITQAAIAQKAQQQVIEDFDQLNLLFSQVKAVAEVAYLKDNNLYLRSVDRLVKLLQIKFAITTKEEDKTLKDNEAEDILQGLLDKLG
jgi:hypothetical protein